MSERRSRVWWVLSEGVPVPALGLSCEPLSPDAWWFPELGFSTDESALFDTREESLAYGVRRRLGYPT